MEIQKTDLQDVLLVKPKIFGDARGFFYESYNEKAYQDAGIRYDFKQDNHSRSQKNILRGLHLQIRYPQGKLVRVTRGSVVDTIVDLRPNSATFKKWQSFDLSSDNALQLMVPPGFAHGFYVTSDDTEFQYKCSEYYHPEDEITLLWNDPTLSINWPATQPQLSKKDEEGMLLERVLELTQESYSSLTSD